MDRDKRPRWTGRRYYVAFGAILMAAVLLIAGVFYWVYNASRQNLINMWKVNTVQMARDVEYYLTRPTDAVVFASRHVEEMMRTGASNAEIGQYLVDETEIFAAEVDSNTTGVYGYCRADQGMYDSKQRGGNSATYH